LRVSKASRSASPMKVSASIVSTRTKKVGKMIHQASRLFFPWRSRSPRCWLARSRSRQLPHARRMAHHDHRKPLFLRLNHCATSDATTAFMVGLSIAARARSIGSVRPSPRRFYQRLHRSGHALAHKGIGHDRADQLVGIVGQVVGATASKGMAATCNRQCW
jgi:hypothetical protein